MDLRGQLTVEPTKTATGDWAVTLPIEDGIAEWLLADSRHGAYLTIDEPGGVRQIYRLSHWRVDRVGTCEHCAHCMQKQLTAIWSA
ncbi:hypothetical protein ACIBQ0_17145 [Nocardia nova]|uniref:hypothetical protein n=1 Tax=Nocardia nova TaxID=37330 RepID=UPI0037BA9B46